MNDLDARSLGLERNATATTAPAVTFDLVRLRDRSIGAALLLLIIEQLRLFR